MTGYQSKKKAASAKTIDEVNWADHEPNGRRAAQEPWPEEPFGHMAGGVQPPQRPWVGLTDEEIWALHDGYPNPVEFARAVLTKSKEKNG